MNKHLRKMKNIGRAIEWISLKIENAKVHCMLHRNSKVEKIIPSLERERDNLYLDLDNQRKNWIRELEEQGY